MVVAGILATPASTFAQSCTPRPRVLQRVEVVNADRMSVTVSAGSGVVRTVRFHVLNGAVVVVPTGPIPGVGDFSISPNTSQLTFDVLRQVDAQPSTVAFTVTDACGEWATFVGAGTPRWGGRTFPPPFSSPWPIRPNVTLAVPPGASQQSRFQAAREAIEFWDSVFSSSLSPFRVGTVTEISVAIPDDFLVAITEFAAGRGPRPVVPPIVSQLPGDLIVAFASNAQFVSWSGFDIGNGRSLTNIDASPGRLRPNVLRNLVAHELGHNLAGLRHNSEPTNLMCGDPAPCGVSRFESSTPYFGRLTEDDRIGLLLRYPPTWRPTGSNFASPDTGEPHDVRTAAAGR